MVCKAHSRIDMEKEKEGEKEWWTIRRREKRKRGKTKKTMLKERII